MNDFLNETDIFILGDIRTYLELLFQLTLIPLQGSGGERGKGRGVLPHY